MTRWPSRPGRRRRRADAERERRWRGLGDVLDNILRKLGFDASEQKLLDILNGGAVWTSDFGAGITTGFDFALDLSFGVMAGLTAPIWAPDWKECTGD
ncbi:MAG TPA: hypothetical protein VMT85_12270 [Thermoanaerobaculia bacterium]|nr:hypothetical protein [Thermoanaerobaculia bacterium]